MRKKQSNPIEIENRIDLVSEMLLQGFSCKDIKERGRELLWNVSPRQIENYIHTAKENISKQKNLNFDYELNLSLNRLEYIYRESLQLQDLKTALNVIEKKCKLLGLPNENVSDNTIHISHNFIINGKSVTKDELDFDLTDNFD